MPNSRLNQISILLKRDGDSIRQEWTTHVSSSWNRRYHGLVTDDELRLHTRRLIEELIALFDTHGHDAPPDISAESPLAELAIELSASRAKLGFRPTDTALYISALKNVLTRRLVEALKHDSDTLVVCLSAVDDVLDRLALLTFDTYVETRERIIAQQSLSLVELSSPVVRLWDQVLLLPLVGIIDTVRARQFTERLLASISKYEAQVAIIDITGVPVFDTGVAKHIMKAVDAAQLLGSRIVLTGLSPEGAQTLTKLNINFSNVINRASLRAGVAEALKLVGRRIVATGAQA
ncbi:STAS domain-containing protein [Zoogloea sp.]|uniref:STAS domain-containing protein n=1 Tax=Zoogloea sp. TaxID=49181 RepID=UPI0026066711|nr:STAS domain-containing protein [uncultured Zoogloea sp.]MCK6387904.1 STAS domain-containing protein [Zoogloea sp.]